MTAPLLAAAPDSGNQGRRISLWDFVSRSEYSLADANPRRRIHSDLREGLEDVTREVMASINACSRQRGRLVEERQALYGYRRRTAAGVDTVLDLLLIYKKYRGRKLTLPVRRHLYLHQHFTGTTHQCHFIHIAILFYILVYRLLRPFLLYLFCL
jgi:hypothetical protein